MKMLSVTGKGLVCKEVELKYLPTGTALAKTTLVNQEEYNGVKTPHFTNLILWGERAVDFANEITKGCIIDITSGILKHPVTESNGKKYYNTEVTVLEWTLEKDLNAPPPPPPAKPVSKYAKKK